MCKDPVVGGKVLCTRSYQEGQCVSSAESKRENEVRQEGRKVSSDESHGEPLGEDGGEAGAPKISLCCVFKRPCWLQTM